MKTISMKIKGDWGATRSWLSKPRHVLIRAIAEKYAKEGVQALSAATPIRTGLTASSWYYEIESNETETAIHWLNSNTNKTIPIALLLQYGHGTNHGGYVQGIDYINPALKPIFDKIADKAWKEVISG